MIIELIVNIALSFFDVVIFLLPDFDFTGLQEAISYFFDVLSKVCYFLPMGTVGAIASIIYSLFIFRLLIASIRAIWGLLPIL